MLGLNVAIPTVLDAQGLFPNWPYQYHTLIGFSAFAFFMGWIVYDKQKHIDKIEESYQYALSLDKFDNTWKNNNLKLGLVISNAIDKAIQCELIAGHTYLEVEGERLKPKSNDKTIIPPGKLAVITLPEIDLTGTFPLAGTLHYKLEYGQPNKPLFKQTRRYKLDIDLVYEDGNRVIEVSGDCVYEVYERIKKSIFRKASSRNEVA
ncbi:MAG: hypothetical protein ABH839_03940 [Chloroflexota bacterium]